MDLEDIRRKKVIETSADLRGDISDALPKEMLRGICARWVPEISELRNDGKLFLEHGYEASAILDFLASELAWGTENGDIRDIPEQRKWNLLYTLESLSLCHASNILTWSATKDGVKPQLETTPWRTGPEKNWYDYDMEPIDSYNLNEKLDRLKIPVYPKYMDDPSRYYNQKDPAAVGVVMGDSLCRSSGLTERISIFNEHLPVRTANDSGTGKWGGLPTFVTPFESDTPVLSASPLVSKINYPEEKMKMAASMFISKKQEITDIYGYMMRSLAFYADEQMAPEQEVPRFYEDRRDITPERCRRFASFFRFAEMDMWKNFDYIMKTYRIQDESQYSMGVMNKGQSDSFTRLDISDSPPKIGEMLMDIDCTDEAYIVRDSDPAYSPKYSRALPQREPKDKNRDNVAYDFMTASVIWKKFNKRKKAMIRTLAIRTLADVRRQYEDITAEISAVEECVARGSFADYEAIREEKGLLMNSRVPTQRFFAVEAFVPIKPAEVSVTFDDNAMGQAVMRMIKDGREKSKESIKSAFSKKEQEDHLRGIATALHSLICMAVDAVEGRSILKDWSADIYSTIQEHSINDAMLPRDRGSKEFGELLRRHGKLAEFISPIDFSKIREGVKLSRYGRDIGGPDSDITTFGEWSQLEQFTPSPGFRPFVERADGLSLRELIRHGIYGTPLQNGLTRDNARYILAPRITKWRLRSSLKDLAKEIREEAAGADIRLLTAHADDPSGLGPARRGIMEFVLSFCDTFAKEAYKTKMDLFNDAKTTAALACGDKPESRLQLMEAAAGSWMLSGIGLYQRDKKDLPDDRYIFEQARQYIGSKNTWSDDEYNEYIGMLSVMSYTKEYTNMPRMIRLGLLDRERYYKRLRLLNYKYQRYMSWTHALPPQFLNLEDYIFGNMIKDNSQYMPLLKALEYPKDPFSGTYNYNLNLENRDLMHTDSYIGQFGRVPARSDIKRLPTGLEKWTCFNKSIDYRYNIALDNMMRIAWHGNTALAAARTFRDVMSRGIMGYDSMYGNEGRYAANGRMGKVFVDAPASFHPDDKRIIKKPIPTIFIKSALPSEEKLELISAYTLSEHLPEIYRDKQRIIHYSALNPKYLFMTLFQPVRRFNNRTLIQNLDVFPKYSAFGYGAFGYDSRHTGDNISDKQRYSAASYFDSYNICIYQGEIPMVPGTLLVEAALRQIRENEGLRREYDSLKEYVYAKECIVARSGNDREDHNWESARMRCLIQDIGYTVRRMREKNADLPVTVMSAAAMDPLARLGEPEIYVDTATESAKQAELLSILRKAYWGADFHNIRKHLNINNERFFEESETPGGCIRKFSARYAYQYEFLKNIYFLNERYRHADNILDDNNSRYLYRDIFYQNCASLTIKRNMREYLRDSEPEVYRGFDSTNLLRSIAFEYGRPLGNRNRRAAQLLYPDSPEYPRYKFGMEYYRDNITKKEFIGWTNKKYNPIEYFICEHQDLFLGNAYLKQHGHIPISLEENKIPYINTMGIMSSGDGNFGIPNFNDDRYHIILRVGDQTQEFPMNVFRNINKDDMTKYVIKNVIKYIYTENKLDPAMNGPITKENVPFLAGILESDLMSAIFKRGMERTFRRRDYYPSSEETAVMARSFRSGMDGFCRHIGIDRETNGGIAARQDRFTDEPPDWVDTEDR